MLAALARPRRRSRLADLRRSRLDPGEVDLSVGVPGHIDAIGSFGEGFGAHRAGVDLPLVDKVAAEGLAFVGGSQKEHVAVGPFARGPIDEVDVALAVGEALHAAAAASPGR